MSEDESVGDIQFSHAADIIELRWTGFISAATVGNKPAELDGYLHGRPAAYAIFDATEVTGFSANSREPGLAILVRLKDHGVKRTCVITQSSLIRMIGSGVALAAGLSIRFFETREQACAEVTRLRTTATRR